jgi:RimJ/RimL family protein N-acetyltransferase
MGAAEIDAPCTLAPAYAKKRYNSANARRSCIQRLPMGEYFLRTARLGFRIWTNDDLELALDLWGDSDVTRLIGGPFSPQQIEERLAREIATYQSDRVQYYPVFLLETGEHVGCCGLRPYQPDAKIYEIGFHLRKVHWGSGYAREAVKAMLAYAFYVKDFSGLFAGHNPANEASRRLLIELSFRYTHDEYYPPTGLNHPSYLMTAEDFAEI